MRHKIQAKKSKLTKIAFAMTMCALTAIGFFEHFAGVGSANPNFADHPSAAFGIAGGQAAILTVVNTDASETLTVRMQFLDENGSVLKTERAIIEPRHSFGLLLPYREISRGENRMPIRAVVRAQKSRNEQLIGSVEVYDEATGKTSFGLLLPAKGFDPQPDPPAPN